MCTRKHPDPGIIFTGDDVIHSLRPCRCVQWRQDKGTVAQHNAMTLQLFFMIIEEVGGNKENKVIGLPSTSAVWVWVYR